MAFYQVLIRNLEGKTICLGFSRPEVSCEEVKSAVAAREGIPASVQRLVSGIKEFGSGRSLAAGRDGFFPSCTLLLRLRGGKGGFGSLLRGAATKAGQKKTSNFDACRDMSGRRLRHVNAEKKLKEWKADAKERELEKTAEDFLKKKRKTKEEYEGVERDLEKFRKESLSAREEIGSAVTDGLIEAAKLDVNLKRKKIEAVAYEVKKARKWSPEDLEEEDDSDDEDEAGPSSSDSGEGSIKPSSDQGEAMAMPLSKVDAALSASVEVVDRSKRVYKQASRPSQAQEPVEMTLEGPASDDSNDEAEHSENCREPQTEVLAMPPFDIEALEGHQPIQKVKDLTGPVDFEDYNTSRHLEILGLERLKKELQDRGLKCGGSLSERAARLFLLKTTELGKLDKSLFSKPSGKPARKGLS